MAGGAALIASTCALQFLMPVTYLGITLWSRCLVLILHLTVGTIAYIGGYLLVPVGRGDLAELAAKAATKVNPPSRGLSGPWLKWRCRLTAAWTSGRSQGILFPGIERWPTPSPSLRAAPNRISSTIMGDYCHHEIDW